MQTAKQNEIQHLEDDFETALQRFVVEPLEHSLEIILQKKKFGGDCDIVFAKFCFLETAFLLAPNPNS